ncbi:hypothetical protein CCACVL1_24979 [Corchorus capsularis]|uniref:Uncharacterized protein n=1 Tax=Corchorus capsularis TaxID=210143 RepID=A0A1R3GMA0_COCAP|nr:hypothetical protein CCACVL1_24979 [Corchorus capsularis]
MASSMNVEVGNESILVDEES